VQGPEIVNVIATETGGGWVGESAMSSQLLSHAAASLVHTPPHYATIPR